MRCFSRKTYKRRKKNDDRSCLKSLFQAAGVIAFFKIFACHSVRPSSRHKSTSFLPAPFVIQFGDFHPSVRPYEESGRILLESLSPLFFL